MILPQAQRARRDGVPNPSPFPTCLRAPFARRDGRPRGLPHSHSGTSGNDPSASSTGPAGRGAKPIPLSNLPPGAFCPAGREANAASNSHSGTSGSALFLTVMILLEGSFYRYDFLPGGTGGPAASPAPTPGLRVMILPQAQRARRDGVPNPSPFPTCLRAPGLSLSLSLSLSFCFG
jgi:hypothetical protein